MSRAVWHLVATASLLVGCRTDQTIVTLDPHLERMLKQPKRLAYEEDPILPRRMVMQMPPEGATPTNAMLGDPVVLAGVKDGVWAARVPVPVDRPMVEAGRTRFETLCAACHGILGDGESVVAEKMTLRPAPSLQDERVRSFPPGRIFQTIREGYGLMPSYASVLSVNDTWGLVEYVRALELARHARVADLPPDVRNRLVKEAP